MLTTPGREELGQRLAERERGERSLLGGLQHHRIAGREGWSQLPGGHHQGIIPGRDRGDDAERIAADHAGVSGGVLACAKARPDPRRAREEAEHVRHGGDLIGQNQALGLAAIERLQPTELHRARVDAIGEREQQSRAILGRGAPPRAKGPVRRGHRRRDLRHRRPRHPGDDLACRRIEHTLDLALPGHELAIDEKVGLHPSSTAGAARRPASPPSRTRAARGAACSSRFSRAVLARKVPS